jgi:hypothetical protein
MFSKGQILWYMALSLFNPETHPTLLVKIPSLIAVTADFMLLFFGPNINTYVDQAGLSHYVLSSCLLSMSIHFIGSKLHHYLS